MRLEGHVWVKDKSDLEEDPRYDKELVEKLMLDGGLDKAGEREKIGARAACGEQSFQRQRGPRESLPQRASEQCRRSATLDLGIDRRVAENQRAHGIDC